MNRVNEILSELGLSKVKLAKYLGVSRQMLYNYLGMNSINEWPKEKSTKFLGLLGVKDEKEIESIELDSDYILAVEAKLADGVKSEQDKDEITTLKGFNKKEQELLSDIFYLLKQKLTEDKSKETFYAYSYLYHYLQSMETNKELKYILAYMSKSMGFTDPNEYAFNQDQQFIFEAILFSGLTLYNNGGSSKIKLAEAHKRFVQDIEHKNEEKLSRTQELNTAKVQALRELGYTEINEDNAKEVLEKIAEIQSRKV
jgi:Holliday junction resolvasome RuvABC DNA-binding subunit